MFNNTNLNIIYKLGQVYSLLVIYKSRDSSIHTFGLFHKFFTFLDQVLEVTARAITYYLDVSAECTRRIVAVDGAIKAMCNRLVVADVTNRTSRDLAEQCIKVKRAIDAGCSLIWKQKFHYHTTNSS